MTEPLGSWRGRRVLVTGHTGFKGAWLAAWLLRLGAEVSGLALAPESDDGVFVRAGLADHVEGHDVDLRDHDGVHRVVGAVRPDVILHLAAQALVGRSYRDPVGTFAVNVTGTASVLDAATNLSVGAVLVVTSDKVYDNDGSGRAFAEADRLGGVDPYSASKAATELVVRSWRDAVVGPGGPRLATARAGNVVGGGDAGEGRLLPDVFRALLAGRPVELRHPEAVRPWQFVLEPLAGYLRYADRLLGDDGAVPTALNFGPSAADACSVRTMVEAAISAWGTGSWQATGTPIGHEAERLVLDASMASTALGWAPRLDRAETVGWTAEWYRAVAGEGDLAAVVEDQLTRYERRLVP